MPKEPKLGIGRGMISLTPEQVVDIRVNGGEDPALVMASVRQAMEMGKTTFEIERWEWRDMLGSVPPGKFVADWWKNLGELRHAPKSLLQLGQEIAGFAVEDYSDAYRNLTPDELKSFKAGDINTIDGERIEADGLESPRVQKKGWLAEKYPGMNEFQKSIARWFDWSEVGQQNMMRMIAGQPSVALSEIAAILAPVWGKAGKALKATDRLQVVKNIERWIADNPGKAKGLRIGAAVGRGAIDPGDLINVPFEIATPSVPLKPATIDQTLEDLRTSGALPHVVPERLRPEEASRMEADVRTDLEAEAPKTETQIRAALDRAGFNEGGAKVKTPDGD